MKRGGLLFLAGYISKINFDPDGLMGDVNTSMKQVTWNVQVILYSIGIFKLKEIEFLFKLKNAKYL